MNLLPIKIRREVIEILCKRILELKNEGKQITYLELKIILTCKSFSRIFRDVINSLHNKFGSKVSPATLYFHCNIILEILDYATYKSLTSIAKKYNKVRHYIREIAKYVLPTIDKYEFRFPPRGTKMSGKLDKTVSNFAEMVSLNTLTKKNYINLSNNSFQEIKEHFRKIKKIKHYSSLFNNLRINELFVNWFLNLDPIRYSKIFTEALIDIPSKTNLIVMCERINKNEEILKYIIYSLIKNDELNPMIIATTSGVSYSIITYYGQILSKLINNINNQPYIDYRKRFSFKYKGYTGANYKTNVMTSDYYIILPENQTNYLISELEKLIHSYRNYFPENFDFKNFLYRNFYTQNLNIDPSELNKIRNSIKYQLRKLTRNVYRADLNYIEELLNLILNIKDFILGGNLTELSNRYRRSVYYIQSIAKKVLPKDIYMKRFYFGHNKDYLVNNIAEKIIIDSFSIKSFVNLINPILQDLMDSYRKALNKTKRDALFKMMHIDLDFANWLLKLKQTDFQKIYKYYKIIPSVQEILTLCANVNKNLEILNYVVFSILKSTDRQYEIARIAGKSRSFIQSCGKLLAKNTSPSTGQYFLRNNRIRFPMGKRDVGL